MSEENLTVCIEDGEFLNICTEYSMALSDAGVPIFRGCELMTPKERVDYLSDRYEGLRSVISGVCEGWTLPSGVRKILEAALWADVEVEDETD